MATTLLPRRAHHVVFQNALNAVLGRLAGEPQDERCDTHRLYEMPWVAGDIPAWALAGWENGERIAALAARHGCARWFAWAVLMHTYFDPVQAEIMMGERVRAGSMETIDLTVDETIDLTADETIDLTADDST